MSWHKVLLQNNISQNSTLTVWKKTLDSWQHYLIEQFIRKNWGQSEGALRFLNGTRIHKFGFNGLGSAKWLWKQKIYFTNGLSIQY